MYEPQEDSYLLQESITEYTKKNKVSIALDMGTGTGIQGFSIIDEVNTLIMTDINKESIHSLREEIKKLEKKKSKTETELRIYYGDLFERIPEEYIKKIDLIIFNPPYLPREKEEKDDPELTSGETGIETTKRFLTDAKKYLSENGVIFFVASSLSDINQLEEHMKNAGYKFKIDRKKHISFEDIIIYESWIEP